MIRGQIVGCERIAHILGVDDRPPSSRTIRGVTVNPLTVDLFTEPIDAMIGHAFWVRINVVLT